MVLVLLPELIPSKVRNWMMQRPCTAT